MMSKILSSHKKAQRYMLVAQDAGDELTPRQARWLADHLVKCRHCQAHAKQQDTIESRLQYEFKSRYPLPYPYQHHTAKQRLKAQAKQNQPQPWSVFKGFTLALEIAIFVTLAVGVFQLLRPTTQDEELQPVPTHTPTIVIEQTRDNPLPTPIATILPTTVVQLPPTATRSIATAQASAIPTKIPASPTPLPSPVALVVATATQLPPPPTSLPPATATTMPSPMPSPTVGSTATPVEVVMQSQIWLDAFFAVRNAGNSDTILTQFANTAVIGSFFNTSTQSKTDIRPWLEFNRLLNNQLLSKDCVIHNPTTIRCVITSTDDLQRALGLPTYVTSLTMRWNNDGKIVHYTDYIQNADKNNFRNTFAAFHGWIAQNHPDLYPQLVSEQNNLVPIRTPATAPIFLQLATEWAAQRNPSP